MNKLWLPAGHHWDLHIEHDRSGDAGPFTGGGWKILWHITVSPWASIDSMVRVLKDKGAEPNLVIGGRPGVQHPIVVQLVPFNRAGRSLRNDPSDGEQTNRANVIQVEICARPGRSAIRGPGIRQFWAEDEDLGCELFDLGGSDSGTIAADVQAVRDFEHFEDFPLCMTDQSGVMIQRAFASGVASWSDDTYKALGNLASLIDNRVPVPRRLARSFQNTKRFTDRGFVTVKGHLGHMHGPDDDHIDPTTDFKGDRLMKYTASAPNQL
jgi:hypothetical protein